MCLNIGTPDNHHFPFGINGRVVMLGVPILKHFRVFKIQRLAGKIFYLFLQFQCIPYGVLLEELDIPNLRALEVFILHTLFLSFSEL